MICEKCGIREANVKYMEVVNGVRTEHNLCMQCARELDFGPYSSLLEKENPLQQLLSGILFISQPEASESAPDICCPTCGMAYSDFVRDSQFGCGDCYHVFDLLIGERMAKIQGNEPHKGKHPRMMPPKAGVNVDESGELRLTPEEELRALEERLKEAVASENYEEAAKIRDSIRAIRAGGEKS